MEQVFQLFFFGGGFLWALATYKVHQGLNSNDVMGKSYWDRWNSFEALGLVLMFISILILLVDHFVGYF